MKQDSMLDFQEAHCDSSVSFGTSPPNTPFVAEGSDLFRAVMEDFRQDNRLSMAVVDVRMKKNIDKCSSADDKNTCRNYLCKRCHSDRTLCRCYQEKSKSAIPRVQWIDEIYDKPLAMEQTITDSPPEGRASPICQNTDYVKPILKHRANCIIIVSE